MTTRRDNLRAVLRGQTPAWVPFAPNFAQWFRHHEVHGTLPDDLRGGDYLDAMKTLDCDIFSRNIDGGVRETDETITPRTTSTPAATGTRSVTVFDTPYGELARVTQTQDAITASHVEEYCVKDWQRDGRAFRYLLDQRRFNWDEKAFDETDARIGDDGLVNVACGCTPLKMLHKWFGLDHTCLFVMDEPAAARELCDAYWASLRPVLVRLAESDKVASVILMDNVDTPFYPPTLARDYWSPYVADAAALMRARGKTLFVHACGQLKALTQVFAEAGVSGLEGIAHPPLGDWTAAEAQACHERFMFVGGFGAHEQETMSDQQVRAFYGDYLPRASRARFIFSSSCQTAIRTTWDRLQLVRELCRQWGGRPREEVMT